MKRFTLAALTLVVCAGAQAASEEVKMNLVTSQGIGQSIGTVKITETDKGLEFSRSLKPSHRANTVIMSMPKAPANRP